MDRLVKLISLGAFLIFLVTGWLFYEFYLKWISVFEDGRYFDPETGVVFHDNSFVWGIFSLAALLISVSLWLVAKKRAAMSELQERLK